MKKVVSIILCIIILSGMALMPCMADDTAGAVQPIYNVIADMTASLSLSSAGLATCTGTTTVMSDSLNVRLSVSLQKYTAGGWQNVALWSKSGVRNVELEKYWNVSESGRYRTCVTVSVYNANDMQLDYAVGYSPEKVYTAP